MEHPKNKRFKDLSGKRFGRLIVMNLHSKTDSGTYKWMCLCDCGNEVAVRRNNLSSGDAMSCGCLQVSLASTLHRKHGMIKTKLYGVWSSMIQRCENPKAEKYKIYGARGIKVCDRWHSFENFYYDMGDKPSPNHSIDRKDNDGDYEPSNCQWSTATEQQRNTRNTKWLVLFDQRDTCRSWCERLGLSYFAVIQRIEKGWNVEKALLTPTPIRMPRLGKG